VAWHAIDQTDTAKCIQRFESEFKINCCVKVQCKPTVRFYNGIMLLGPPATDSRIEISSAMLWIIDAKKADSGSYRCEVSNAAGIHFQSLTFNVMFLLYLK